MSVEIVDIARLLSLPEPEWLIEDYLHQYEIGVIYGQPNVGKSFVALDWALSIAAGIPWLDSFKTRQAPVLYLAGEGGPSLQKRVDSWLKFHKLSMSAVPIYFQLRPIALREEDVIVDVCEALAEIHTSDGVEPGVRPGLVVVDTLSQFLMGGDENGTDMALFVSNLRRLSQEEDMSVLIVHHTNKGGESERGHTALRGNVDVMFKVTGKETSGLLTGIEILNDKQRDNPKAESGKIEVSSFHRSLVLSLGKPSKLPESVMELSTDFLVNLIIHAGNIVETSTETFHTEEWRIQSGLLPSTFVRQRNMLLKAKLVKGAGHGKYAFTPRGWETMYFYKKQQSNPRHVPSQILPSPLCNREGEGNEEKKVTWGGKKRGK